MLEMIRATREYIKHLEVLLDKVNETGNISWQVKLEEMIVKEKRKLRLMESLNV